MQISKFHAFAQNNVILGILFRMVESRFSQPILNSLHGHRGCQQVLLAPRVQLRYLVEQAHHRPVKIPLLPLRFQYKKAFLRAVIPQLVSSIATPMFAGLVLEPLRDLLYV